MKNDTVILIPARWGSSRLEGKPLIDLGGIPMIKRVYNICKQSSYDVYVLTDDERIMQCVGKDNSFIDDAEYENGTERCCGALTKFNLSYDKIINVQGDMPDVTVEMIAKTKLLLDTFDVATVYTAMPKDRQNDPSSVKLIRSTKSALWFGRGMSGYGDWHLGVYGYKQSSLLQYNTLPVTLEEKIEKLEQLRWLKNNITIGCEPVSFNGIEINTLTDVSEWQQKNYQ